MTHEHQQPGAIPNQETLRGRRPLLETSLLRRSVRDIVAPPPRELVVRADGKRDRVQTWAQGQVRQWQALDELFDAVKGNSKLSNGAPEGYIIRLSRGLMPERYMQSLATIGILPDPDETYSPVAMVVAFYIAEQSYSGNELNDTKKRLVMIMAVRVAIARAAVEAERLSHGGEHSQ